MRNLTILLRLVNSPDDILPKGRYITDCKNKQLLFGKISSIRKISFSSAATMVRQMADSYEIQNAHFKFYNFTHYQQSFIFLNGSPLQL